jgi:hypothetical protein
LTPLAPLRVPLNSQKIVKPATIPESEPCHAVGWNQWPIGLCGTSIHHWRWISTAIRFWVSKSCASSHSPRNALIRELPARPKLLAIIAMTQRPPKSVQPAH